MHTSRFTSHKFRKDIWNENLRLIIVDTRYYRKSYDVYQIYNEVEGKGYCLTLSFSFVLIEAVRVITRVRRDPDDEITKYITAN